MSERPDLEAAEAEASEHERQQDLRMVESLAQRADEAGMSERDWQDAGHLDPTLLVGKTIDNLPLVSDSWLEIRFTDGSELHLTGDAGGYQRFIFFDHPDPADTRRTEEE